MTLCLLVGFIFVNHGFDLGGNEATDRRLSPRGQDFRLANRLPVETDRYVLLHCVLRVARIPRIFNQYRFATPALQGNIGNSMLPRIGHRGNLDHMDDHIFNIAEAKMHLSRLIERVERGDEIIIARNHRPVAVLVPARRSAAEILARIDNVRERIRERTGGSAIRQAGESWRTFIETGHRL